MTSPRTTARSGTHATRSDGADEDHAIPGAHPMAADRMLDRRTTPDHPPPRFTLHALAAPPARVGGGSR
jgi:hypothetical protein